MWMCIVVPYVLFGFLEVGVTSTCARTKCEKGMISCCLMKNNNPYQSCIRRSESCKNHWSRFCEPPCFLKCTSTADSSECLCSAARSQRCV
uniref:Uncharacterized protein n=1 Tax=Rhipicephalus appendiculatus TaxID=34631 RepID=A0A131YJ58_RHIAP